ncbi:MAG: hypothetical protein RL745_682 [Actinomycetota bacterium]|jgi:3-dehydroquinate synthase
MSFTVVDVAASNPYPVIVGDDAVAVLADDEFVRLRNRMVLIIHNPDVRDQAERVASHIAGRARRVTTWQVPSGEAAKNAQVAVDAWTHLAEAGFDRGGLIIAVGGGATTDAAGFVAATWMRGVDIVHVPTTTAGMVDAAIGGKTAIDIPAGKNLVGAFHDPRAVICDLNFLAGLPEVEFRSGLAEVLKCGFIGATSILAGAEADPKSLYERPKDAFLAAINIKANVVAMDARENSLSIGRELLNYGHTFGHALETLSGYTVRHGEAVAIGMVFAAEVSHRLGRCSADFVERHRRVISSVGLPIVHRDIAFDDALAVMARDKKVRDGKLRMILLAGPGDAFAATDIDRSILLSAFAATRG